MFVEVVLIAVDTDNETEEIRNAVLAEKIDEVVDDAEEVEEVKVAVTPLSTQPRITSRKHQACCAV